MEIIRLNCTSLTPLFIGNANTKEAELRPSAFEGSLRYWWRALHPTLDKGILRKEEAKFFGGSFKENNETINRLPSYRFLRIDGYNSDSFTKEVIETDPRGGKGKSKAFIPNQKFTIHLQILKNEAQVKAIFYLASALGGVGQRSRRGSGAWKIDNFDYSPSKICKDIQLFNNDYYLNNNIIKLNNINNTKGFPHIQEIEFGAKFYNNSGEFRLKVMQTAHLKKDSVKEEILDENGEPKQNRNGQIIYKHPVYDKYLGKAQGGKLSSPIYVTAIKENNHLKPVITTLWHNSDNNHTKGKNLQTAFKNAILYGQQ